MPISALSPSPIQGQCKRRGGHLASIQDEQEQEAIASFLQRSQRWDDEDVWLGLSVPARVSTAASPVSPYLLPFMCCWIRLGCQLHSPQVSEQLCVRWGDGTQARPGVSSPVPRSFGAAVN